MTKHLNFGAAALLAGTVLAGIAGAPRIAAAGVVVVNRGLPTADLNNAAGSNRSNVAWADITSSHFYGDTFTLPDNKQIPSLGLIKSILLHRIVSGIFTGVSRHDYVEG